MVVLENKNTILILSYTMVPYPLSRPTVLTCWPYERWEKEKVSLPVHFTSVTLGEQSWEDCEPPG